MVLSIGIYSMSRRPKSLYLLWTITVDILSHGRTFDSIRPRRAELGGTLQKRKISYFRLIDTVEATTLQSKV